MDARRAQRLLLAGLVTAGVAGCGHDAPTRPAAAPPPGLGATPAALRSACARERITCPRRWPVRLDGRSMPARAARTMEPGVLLDVSNGFCGRPRCRGIFHADLGEQPAPFPPVSPRLRFPTRTRTVPIRGGGRFVQTRAPRRLATVRVGGARAAVYQAAPYPQGGLHGGHVAVLWNAGGRGHLVSLHAVGLAREEVVRLAVAVARSETG